MSSLHPNNGIHKPRGLENAELQHLKHLNKANQTVPVQNQEPLTENASSFDPYLVATVEIGNYPPVSQTAYSPSFTPAQVESPDNQVDIGNDILIVENGAKLNLNSSVEVDNAEDLMIIGNGAKVNWNSTVGIDNGNDTVIIGNGAKVEFNGNTGIDNGDDTLIIGNGAKVKINSVTGTDNGSGTLIIGEGADIEITGSMSVDNSKGITYLDGKLRIHLVDEMKQSIQMEVNVKDKEEAASIQEFLHKKMKNKRFSFDDLKDTVREAQESIKLSKDKKNKNTEVTQLREETKPINIHQLRLEMLQSLVQNLFQPKFHANQGLHKGFTRNVDVRI